MADMRNGPGPAPPVSPDRPADPSPAKAERSAVRVTRGSDLLHSALGYAAFGWWVFPVRPGGKRPLTPNGFKDASRGPAVICEWWARWPQANIGICTGWPGPDVLDVDVRDGESGYPSYNRLVRAGLTMGAMAVVRTPSGGMHVYYPGSEQRGGSLPRHNLDFQAVGKYVLAPPSSVHGRHYELIQRPDGERQVFDWQAAKAVLDPPRKKPAREFTSSGKIEHLAAWVAAQPHGNHNSGLFWAACRAVAEGNDPWPLVDAVVEAGHDEGRARRTVASALRGGAR